MRLPSTPNKSTLQQMKFEGNYLIWVGTIKHYLSYTVRKIEQYQAWPAKQKSQEQVSR